MEQPILQVEHLTKFFSVGPHAEVHAVDDVNFTLRRGRTFGLVGESGCGKSSCARTINAWPLHHSSVGADQRQDIL